jgi:hypothetical protein
MMIRVTFDDGKVVETTFEEFAAANDTWHIEELELIRTTLTGGEKYHGGGGASLCFVISPL